MMKTNKTRFLAATTKVGLDPALAETVWAELSAENESKFNIENSAFYFGALIVMSAMGWFMTKAWDAVGGLAIAGLGFVYFIIFLLAGRYVWFRKNLIIPGGLLFTVSVWMLPLLVFGLEKYTGFWPQEAQQSFRDYHLWIRGSWILMETVTIVGGLIMLRYIKFPFLTFPIAFSLWYLSMDLAPALFGQELFTWEQKQQPCSWVPILSITAPNKIMLSGVIYSGCLLSGVLYPR
jgi:hypothetical protein